MMLSAENISPYGPRDSVSVLLKFWALQSVEVAMLVMLNKLLSTASVSTVVSSSPLRYMLWPHSQLARTGSNIVRPAPASSSDGLVRINMFVLGLMCRRAGSAFPTNNKPKPKQIGRDQQEPRYIGL